MGGRALTPNHSVAATRRDGPPRPAPGLGDRPTLVVFALLVAYLLAAWGFALPMPFIGDDYAILAHVRDASFADLWSTRDLLWAWYRPWSRELHFWLVFRGFGANEIAFHVASFVLWLAAMTLYFVWVRGVAGVRAAGIATAGWAAMSAWSGAMLWAAGAQELWLLVFALLYLHAMAARRTGWSLVFLVGALLSKEMAAVLPLIGAAFVGILERPGWRQALRRILPAMAVTLVWAFMHPTLVLRLLSSELLGVEVATHTLPMWRVPVHAVLDLVNLANVPRPVSGIGGALKPALPAVAVVLGFAIWTVFGGRRPPKESASPSGALGRERVRSVPVALFGAAWATIAGLALLLPSIDWHPYYALLGAAGAWLALGVGLARAPAVAVVLIGLVALLGPLQNDTGRASFSNSLYQRRQAYFIGRLRNSLLEMHPQLPSHARLYFARVPQGIGLGHSWFSPAFEVWYGDATITGSFWSAYRPRPLGAPQGPDLFFRYDSAGVRWIEVRRDVASLEVAQTTNPHWLDDQRQLATIFARAQDWPAASETFELLHQAHPESVGFVVSAAVAAEVAHDSIRAERLYARVLEQPGVSANDAAFARGFRERWRSR